MSYSNKFNDRVRRIIEEEIKLPKVGRVISVTTHTSDSDHSNHEVDVEWPPNNSIQTFRGVTLAQPITGGVYVPTKGDFVLLEFLDGDSERPIVTRCVYASDDEDRAPKAHEGDIVFKRGNIYFEIDGDGKWARFAKKNSDLAEPDAKIELDESGNVTTQGSESYVGSFTVTGAGTISITSPGFTPSMIEFNGEAVGGQNVDRSGGTGSNAANYQGSFTGVARDDGYRQVIHSGLSGDSVNQTSHYSSDSECIAIRYAGQSGGKLGMLLGDVVSWDSDGFTVDITSYTRDEVVTFTAYS